MMLEVRDQLNFEKGVTEGRLQGEAVGLRKGIEQGTAEGMRKGLEEGENRFARLTSKLLSLGRADELAEAAADPALKERLYSELGIA